MSFRTEVREKKTRGKEGAESTMKKGTEKPMAR
jgi:hypothetical protein